MYENEYIFYVCTYTGTGKSVIGAHLAYAHIIINNPNLQCVPSSTDEKIKCVMYCGPSNKSLDVVLGMYAFSKLKVRGYS